MPKFIVTYWETFSDDYEVEAETEDKAYAKVWDDIFNDRREGPNYCVGSGYRVKKVEEKKNDQD